MNDLLLWMCLFYKYILYNIRFVYIVNKVDILLFIVHKLKSAFYQGNNQMISLQNNL